MKMSFSEEMLINYVREREHLYNIYCKDYRDKQLREKAWIEIAALFTDSNASFCAKRWNSLRDTFVRKRNELKQHTSGQAAKKSKPWPFYDCLLFLEQYLASTTKMLGTTTTSLQCEESQCEQSNSNENDQSCEDVSDRVSVDTAMCSHGDVLEASSSKRHKPQGTSVKKVNKVKGDSMSLFETEILNKMDTAEDEDDLFGKSIGCTLKRMSRMKKAYVKSQIMRLLYEAEFDDTT